MFLLYHKKFILSRGKKEIFSERGSVHEFEGDVLIGVAQSDAFVHIDRAGLIDGNIAVFFGMGLILTRRQINLELPRLVTNSESLALMAVFLLGDLNDSPRDGLIVAVEHAAPE